MLIPKIKYPGQTDTADAGYPHGKARNATTLNDGTGFPIEKDWVNDLLGAKQALVEEAGIEPSGEPDEVGASDELDALDVLFYRKAGTNAAISAAISAAIATGTYTPGAFNASSCTVGTITAIYSRAGSVVTVNFRASVTETGSGEKSFDLDLPIDPGSNFADGDAAHGVLTLETGGATYHPGTIRSRTSSKRVTLAWYSSDDSGADNMRGSFSYRMS